MVSQPSQADSLDYFDDDDSQFLEALGKAVLPGDEVLSSVKDVPTVGDSESQESEELEPPPPGQPKRKRSLSPEPVPHNHHQIIASDDTYGASTFGGFGDYMRRKRAKLQVQNEHMKEDEQSRPKTQGIFHGLAIYINGWTRPSVQVLRELILLHGGVFHAYLDRKDMVTHIITCSLTPAKAKEFKHMKVARPEWLTDSAERGYLLDWKDYEYTQQQNSDPSQGVPIKQATIKPPHGSSSLSGQSLPTPSSGSVFKTKEALPAPDPLYTTDPATKADAKRVPGYAAASSNPNAKRAMQDPEWRKANTAASSNFIDGYYKNSRLHHMSAWKAELKELVREAQERAEAGPASEHVGKVEGEGVSMKGAMMPKSPGSKWKGKGKANDHEERVIMHCDFDCFFVSAGLVSRPELKGKPVVVCHSQGGQGGVSSTSEIASSSYEARDFGIRNGMSLQQARKLCPDVVTIPYEFERYKEFSLKFYTILMSHADDLQAVSVDEALIDVTSTVNQMRERYPHSVDPAKEYAEMIRTEVRKQTTCEVSVGISHNIILARLATRKAKPGGSYHLLPEDVDAFLEPLNISDLWGFGYSTKQKAQEKLGVTSLGELKKRTKGALMDALGNATGETLYNALRGIDHRQLESDKPRKSVSCDITYGIRFETNDEAEAFVRQMAAEVQKRLDSIDMVGHSITTKVMKRDPTAPVEPAKFLGHGPCDLFNKQMPLAGPGGKPTSDPEVIADHAWRLVKSFHFDPKELRGLGIQIQKLQDKHAVSKPPQGQALLDFHRKAPPKVGTSAAAAAHSSGPTATKASQTRGKSVKPPATDIKKDTTFDLPSFSQVDTSVLDALPPDIRAELEQEYKRRRSATPSVTKAVEKVKEPSVPPTRRSVTPSIFPAKPTSKANYSRIAQQLAPRNHASVSPKKSSVYNRHAMHDWLSKPKEAPRVKISDAALRELNLEPEIFFALPIDVQREQLIMARVIKTKGFLPEPPKERKVLKPRKVELPPDYVVYRAPKPQARHPEVPVLRRQGKDKKDKQPFSETADIQRILELWIKAYKRWPPKDKDVDYLGKYLVQAIDGRSFTDASVERAISIMKWWQVLSRRYWPSSETEDEEYLLCSPRDLVGEAWWAAFRRVKAQMDEVAKSRWGGKLSLK